VSLAELLVLSACWLVAFPRIRRCQLQVRQICAIRQGAMHDTCCCCCCFPSHEMQTLRSMWCLLSSWRAVHGTC
jgi:hypothetical protein